MNINFDYYSISLLLGGFTALLSGFVVFIHNRRNIENKAWLYSNLTSAIWSFGYFSTITASNHTVAYYSDWVLHSAAVFIPVFYLLSVLSITGEYYTHKVHVVVTALIGFVFLVMVPTKLFVKDVIPKAHFNYVPDAGPAYIYFTIFFFAVVVYTLYFVFKKLRQVTDPVQKARLKYIIIFTIFGFGGGGSVFFLTFNINILPYPLILFSIYPLVSGYAIFRYQLFDVKVITTELIVFIFWIFLLIRVFISNSFNDAIVSTVFLVFMIVVGILLIRSVIKEVKLREQVEKLAEDLQKANLGQSNLIHFMNHQVKGRFGNAKNIFAELLTDDYGTMPEDALPLLRKGLEETNMGVDYVQSILHGASAENGTLPYEMADMNFKDLVEEVFAKQKDYAENKGLKISLDVKNGDYLIKGDVTQLGEAVKNLIDNSINYTMQGSIDVSLEAKDYIKLTIKDTGVGISPEDKPKLFKSGGRGENSLKINVNSTGYGLAFVKGVVDAHKGRVWAESEGANKGSIFYMELPKN
jgi:signal transduction histidine kinase